MFNLRLCNAATIRYSLFKFGHMHLCGKDYKYFSPHCCKCNSFGCIATIRCVNACHGPHSDSVYSGSEHRQFNSPRLVKREAGFPNPRRALIGSNQLWRVNDSPYYREYIPVLLFKRVSTSTSPRTCFSYEHRYSFFVYLGLQFKWNQLSSNKSRHNSCIHKGLYEGKWPDLLTSKPGTASTLRYHWTNCTGPTLADAITQWSPNGMAIQTSVV